MEGHVYLFPTEKYMASHTLDAFDIIRFPALVFVVRNQGWNLRSAYACKSVQALIL